MSGSKSVAGSTRVRERSSLDRRAFLAATSSATALWLTQPGSALGKSLRKDDLTRLTLHEAATRVRNRDVSPVELTQACLARIERYDSKINAFITVTSQLALEQAQAAEQEIRNGNWRGPLHGIPIALKDYIDTAGIRTTAANVFVDRIPTQDADVVRRLKQAGAVLLGKLNCGSATESYGGPVHNPWALDHECGYTSSGSGAAVAADLCFGALGTDMGGSVRLPASACGVVGLKPTYGLVSSHGLIPGAVSLDHVGPMCKTVLDAALMLQSMAGYDPNWAASTRVDLPDYAAALREDRKPLRLGIPKAGFFDELDPEVAQLIDAALETMSTIGTIRNDHVMTSPYLEKIIPRYWEINDGLKAEWLAYYAPVLEKTPERFQPDFRKSMASALQKCTSGIEYVNKLHELQEARRQAAEIFKDEIDLLVMPTSKRLPLTIKAFGTTWQPTREQVEQDVRNTLPFNVLGLPAISVPCGYTKSGLPVGVQIVGRPFAETQVLAFAHAYEQATKWHLRKPKLQ